MTDATRDWLSKLTEAGDVKKGLVPDQGMLPPINLPQQPNTSSSSSSSGNDSSAGQNSLNDKK